MQLDFSSGALINAGGASLVLLAGAAILAGTFLFAANPIQRRIERIGSSGMPGATPAADREESFRAAVRMALKDRQVTRYEERQLLVLADHLGIRPARAFQLRDAIQAERPGAR